MARKGSDHKKKKLPQVKDLRSMNLEELRKSLFTEQEELMRARFKHASATLEDTAELKTRRRQIARIETIIHEKELRS